jgi:asparagine synthase (glutamine-hydrolysing)
MPDRTLFEGVYQVPPGHCLTATMTGMRTLRYWDFNYSLNCYAADLTGN